MRPLRGARASGFTFVEAMTVVAIIAIGAAVAMPNMSNWLLARRAQSAIQYYLDGMVLARTTAIQHNMASRMVLNPNAVSGQMEWTVDYCLPTSAASCDDQHGNWSTVTTPVQDAFGANLSSVTRSGSGLPPASAVVASFPVSGATTVYFTSFGWLNPAVTPQMTKLILSPSLQKPNAFAQVAIALTLAGMPSRCDPNAAAHTRLVCPQ